MIPGNWSWTDNTTFNFNNWAPSEPKNQSMSCGSITIQSALWTSDECFTAKPYVCEIPTKSNPVYANCSSGWIYFEPTGFCYGTDSYVQYITNWTTAENYCQSQSGSAHLISIHNYDENKFVSTLISYPGTVWTGLYSNDNEKTWKWSDGSSVDYLPWLSGYPSLNVSSCVYMGPEYLVDVDCTTAFYTICKKPLLVYY
jgi:C-type mannose receptor